VSAHDPRRIRSQLEVVSFYRLATLACEPPGFIPLESLVIFRPNVGIYCPRVNITARIREEAGACNDVFERGSGEAEGAIRGEQGEGLNVNGMIRSIERNVGRLLRVCRYARMSEQLAVAIEKWVRFEPAD